MQAVFTILPFKPAHLSIYEEIIKPLVNKLGYQSVIGRDFASSDIIIKEIIESILSAELIIADVSGKNSNVNYELGVADAYK